MNRLGVVALHGPGARAVPSLRAYLRLDLEHEWGSAPFVAAVLERLNATPPPGATISDQCRSYVDRMLSVARRLAAAEQEDSPSPAVG
jgi:hypothetical protein